MQAVGGEHQVTAGRDHAVHLVQPADRGGLGVVRPDRDRDDEVEGAVRVRQRRVLRGDREVDARAGARAPTRSRARWVDARAIRSPGRRRPARARRGRRSSRSPARGGRPPVDAPTLARERPRACRRSRASRRRPAVRAPSRGRRSGGWAGLSPVFSSTAGTRTRRRGSATSVSRCDVVGVLPCSAPVGRPARSTTAATSASSSRAYSRSVACAVRRLVDRRPRGRSRSTTCGTAVQRRQRSASLGPAARARARAAPRAARPRPASAARPRCAPATNSHARLASGAPTARGRRAGARSRRRARPGRAAPARPAPSAPNTASALAPGELDARQPAGQHLLRDQRVVRQRQAQPDGRLGVGPGELARATRRRGARRGTACRAARRRRTARSAGRGRRRCSSCSASTPSGDGAPRRDVARVEDHRVARAAATGARAVDVVVDAEARTSCRARRSARATRSRSHGLAGDARSRPWR